MEQINILVPKGLLEEFDEVIAKDFPSRNEAVRYAMRLLIQETKRFVIDYPSYAQQG